MPSVKIRRHTSYTIEHEGSEYEVEHEPADYQDIVVRKLDDGRTVVGYLSHDDDPMNPRTDCDNFGTMVCWHSRHNLGDEHDFKDPAGLWREIVGDDTYEALDEKYGAEQNKWHEAHPNESYGGKAHMAMIDDTERRRRNELMAEVEKRAIVLPLYLYDHSGITMSTGSFADPWDSGQVGYIYVTHEQVLENWSRKTLEDPVDYHDGKPPKPCRERALDLLESEVAEYDKYLTGDAWGVCVEVFDKDGDRIEDEDEACWGFLGDDYAEEEMKSVVEATVGRLLEEDSDSQNA